MGKAIALYLVAIALIGAGHLIQGLGWLTAVAIVALVLWLIGLSHVERRSLHSLGLQPIAGLSQGLARAFLIGLTLPMLLTALLVAIGAIMLYPTSWPAAFKDVLVWGIFLGVVKTAISVTAEEFVFRGYFLGRFVGPLGKPFAVVVSSLMFSLIHLPAMLAVNSSVLTITLGLLSWTVFGVALGLGFIRNNCNLAFPWALHFGYNLGYSLVGFVAAILVQAPVTLVYVGEEWWTGRASLAPESGMLGLVLEISILVTVLAVSRTGVGRAAAGNRRHSPDAT